MEESSISNFDSKCEVNQRKNQENVVNENKSDHNSIEKCQQWLSKKCSISEINTDSCQSVHSSTVSESETNEETEDENCMIKQCGNCIISDSLDASQMHDANNTYGQVAINSSRHVVIGNVTYVTGPVHLSQTSSYVQQQKVVNQIFLDASSNEQKTDRVKIISRLNWLAQPPFSKTPLATPVKFVIIAHTATEEGFTQAKNTLLVRLIQTFHIESRNFVDISYNFLVGADGLVYEGRGWNLQGEHTHGYNEESIAISFVGCFMDHLPSEKALQAAKALIKNGLTLGYISQDYILCGHCQCLPIESPGRVLYEEIKKWPHWKELEEQ